MDQLRIDNKNDANRANEKFMFREPLVVLPIILLTLLCVIGTTVDQERYIAYMGDESIYSTAHFYSIVNFFGVLPGVLLVPFMLEVHGRKPTFILLFSVTLLTSILSFVPYQRQVAVIGNFITAIMRGGVLTITCLAICEYSSPKHRFAFLVANNAVQTCAARTTSLLYSTKVISNEWSYLSLIEALISLACLVVVIRWPESPYWLRQQGRVEESRVSLLWLRAEGSAAREELRAIESMRRRASPKLFWLALIIAILFITIANCGTWTEIALYAVETETILANFSASLRSIIFTCCCCVITVLLVLISYKVNRKLIYLASVVIPFAVMYILSVWFYFGFNGEISSIRSSGFALSIMPASKMQAISIIVIICKSLIECGPVNLSFALFIEGISQKYYTYTSCVGYLFLYAINLVTPLFYVLNVPIYVILPVLATLAIVAVSFAYWLSPETRNQNLLGIEKLSLTRFYHQNSEQAEDVLTDVQRSEFPQ